VEDEIKEVEDDIKEVEDDIKAVEDEIKGESDAKSREKNKERRDRLESLLLILNERLNHLMKTTGMRRLNFAICLFAFVLCWCGCVLDMTFALCMPRRGGGSAVVCCAMLCDASVQ
jgi:hypothetical protein